MNTEISAHNMSLTPAIKEHIEEKIVARIAHLFPDPATRARVVVDLEGRRHDPLAMKCHVTVWPPKGRAVNMTKTTSDLYQSIAEVGDLLKHRAHDRKIARERRHKTARVRARMIG